MKLYQAQFSDGLDGQAVEQDGATPRWGLCNLGRRMGIAQ